MCSSDLSIPESSQSPNAPILGKYIGNSAVSGSTISIDYNTYLVDKTTNVYDLTKEYFDTTKAKYNEILKKYGKLILPVFFSPLYKKKYKMDIYDSISTTTEIELFGETDQNKKITDLLNGFKDALVKKLNSLTSISQFFEFDKFLVDYKLKRSDDIFKPYILSIIENNIKDLESIQLDGIYTNRNKLIDAFDRLNFIMSSNGKDGKRENSDTIVGAQLNSFNPNSFYDRYDNVVDFIKKEHAESFTNDLDTTINFNQRGSMTITDDIFRDILGIFLNEKVTEIEKLYEDSQDSFFTKQVVNKIGRKVEKILVKTKEKKIKYKVPHLKNTKPVIYSTVIVTLNGTEENNLKKIHNSMDQSSSTKLNYFR